MLPKEGLNLFIIAGLNGAGKSLFSAKLVKVDCEVFDGDKYVSALKEKYPEIGSDLLQDRVDEHEFRQSKEHAIREKRSFAFETNFSSSDPAKSLREFRTAGYNVHLLFIGMSSVAECIQRVWLRVTKGGHRVFEDSIIYNFEHGYLNLYKFFNEFDTITLFDNSISNEDEQRIPKKILYVDKGVMKLYADWIAPDWVKKLVDLNNKKSA
ncbi:MAG: zeta toxin family protein [Chitinophagaceae bacterium]|nr:zeta toxin family protein [Chitinophagaceae bacterium]